MTYPPQGPPGNVGPYGRQSYPGAPAPQWQGAQPPLPPVPPSQPKKRARGGLGIAIALCGALLLLAGSGIVVQMYSNSRQVVSNAADFGPVMWRNERADRVLPNTLTATADTESQTDDRRALWKRLHISEEKSCDEGLTYDTAEIAKKQGCKAVLRATYGDVTGNTVATVALIVLSAEGAAEAELDEYFTSNQEEEGPRDAHVVTLPAPHTVAAEWGEEDRIGGAADVIADSQLPYAIAVVAGTTDGRKLSDLPPRWAKDFDDGVSERGPWDATSNALVETYKQHLMKLQKEEAR